MAEALAGLPGLGDPCIHEHFWGQRFRGHVNWGCPAVLVVWHQLSWVGVGLRPASWAMCKSMLRNRCPGSPVSMHRHWAMAPLAAGAGRGLSVSGWPSSKGQGSTLLPLCLH